MGEEIELVVSLLKLFKDWGAGGFAVGGLYILYKHRSGIGPKLEAYTRLYLKNKALSKPTVSVGDIKAHKYFNSLDGYLAGVTFTTVEAGGSTTDFKMYVADVVSYINHKLYKSHLEKYLMGGKYVNMATFFPVLLSEFSLATEVMVGKCLNPEVAQVYKKATEAVRSVYFDTIQSVLASEKLEENQRVWVLLDLLNYRLSNSHTLLYKIFLEMNGKIESQADKVTILTKKQVNEILNNN